MKYTKRLFKHGDGYALVLPSEFTQFLKSDDVTVELKIDEEYNPTLVVEPFSELDIQEHDPLFAAFIEAIYHDAKENPERLVGIDEVLTERVKMLIDGVDVGDCTAEDI